MGNVKVGLIGCGRWGKLVLRDLVKLNCLVTVVARSEKSRENACAGGAFLIVESIAELKDIDAVVVCSTTIAHYQVILEALDKLGNLPIFCEKPLTVSVAEANHLLDRAGKNIFIMDKWRYHPGIIELKKIVETKKLGKVIGIETCRTDWGCPHHDVDPVWILMPHDLAIVLEILGYIPQPKTTLVDFFNEKVYGMTAILGDSPWVISSVGARSIRYKREIKLYCEQGIAELNDSYAEEVVIARSDKLPNNNEAIIEKISLSKEMPLFEELSAFIKFVQGGPAPKSSCAEGVLVVERIAKIRELAGIK